MEIRVLETRYDYEKIKRDPVFISAPMDFDLFGRGAPAWCGHCLSRIRLIDPACPLCHAPTGDDTPFLVGILSGILGVAAAETVPIYVSQDVMTSKLSKAERMRLDPPEPPPPSPPPPPRGWFTKILDFLQAGI